MPSLPEAIITLLATFAYCFTRPSWKHAQVLLVGAILCNGKRTVTSCLTAMGLANEPHYDRYHSFLSKSVFNEFQLVKILLGLLLTLLPSGFPILIAMDETIERRKGPKINAKGCYRDAARSTHNLVVHCFGLKWQCAAILIRLPWNNRYWALPFMTVLCKPNKCTDINKGYKVINMNDKNHRLDDNIGYYEGYLYYDKNGINTPFPDSINQKLLKNTTDKSPSKLLKIIKRNISKLGKKNMELFTLLCGQHKLRHRTSIDYAIIMMKKISGILKKPWILLGDGGFSCVRLALACNINHVTLISRLRLSAALYNLAPISPPGKKGRKPFKGSRVIALKELIKTSKDWQDHNISWYGNTTKKLQLLTGTNLWCTRGYRPILIRYVLVQDPATNKVQAFFSTDINLSAVAIVEYFIMRWNIETTFEEVRAHLGVETQRQWSDKAINRTTPLLMGIFSLVCIIAHKLSHNIINNINSFAISTAWYKKNGQATFSDVMLYVKQAILGVNLMQSINNTANTVNNATNELNVVNNNDNLGKKLNDCINSCLRNSIINDDYVQIPRNYFDKIVNLRC